MTWQTYCVTFDTKDTTEVKAFVNGRLKLILNKLSDPANKTVTLGSFVRIGYENNVFTHMEKTFER
jgi:hypothetical protein